ncbi:MAG: di-heme enzyme [Gallionella sp.]|nr:di-heme enzyme [Gallionella sp.]MDD4958252.1 di-heme enzyme [Gallionella sp.]
MFSTMRTRNKMLFGVSGLLLLLGGLFFYRQPPKMWQWDLPPHFPMPRIPADNLMSESKFQLGRSLFYDKRLSGNGTMACASCHFQHLAFTDGKAVATGSTGMHTLRSSQGLANSAYHPYFTWANYSLPSLEKQMLNPLLGENPVEMGMNDGTMPIILKRLLDDANYVQQFKQVFPEDAEPLTLANCIKAIATFQRGLISANSRYDQYLQHKVVLSDSEARGRSLFFSEKAQCSHCHGSFNFNDQVITADSQEVSTPFHNTGLYNVDGKGGFPEGNRGIFELANKTADMGAFRAPSLRNVAVTAPYMHDGSIQNLSQVLDFYAGHGRVITQGEHQGDGRLNPFKDARINRIDLSAQDKADLIAFLNTLTDSDFLRNPRFSDPFGVPHAAQ